MGQLVTEHGQRRRQPRPPGHGEGSPDGQAVGEVVDPVTDGDHVREQPLFWTARQGAP